MHTITTSSMVSGWRSSLSSFLPRAMMWAVEVVLGSQGQQVGMQRLGVLAKTGPEVQTAGTRGTTMAPGAASPTEGGGHSALPLELDQAPPACGGAMRAQGGPWAQKRPRLDCPAVARGVCAALLGPSAVRAPGADGALAATCGVPPPLAAGLAVTGLPPPCLDAARGPATRPRPGRWLWLPPCHCATARSTRLGLARPWGRFRTPARSVAFTHRQIQLPACTVTIALRRAFGQASARIGLRRLRA
mmetsp:Transcript_26098/g.82582  ORF Transcript_26098/g.82582 Transcript_26098/m.82582 type:complete len:246 (-) Transcript_26098:124-861(-)